MLFKYISCYCLSMLRQLISRWGINSNTSHVIVYRQCRTLMHSWKPDSNTSHVIVYLLSGDKGIALHLFKYISCYCLSRVAPRFCNCYFDSNTSHVIVYRERTGDRKEVVTIQIHLMLLFIRSSFSAYWSCRDSNTSHVIVYLYCFFISH